MKRLFPGLSSPLRIDARPTPGAAEMTSRCLPNTASDEDIRQCLADTSDATDAANNNNNTDKRSNDRSGSSSSSTARPALSPGALAELEALEASLFAEHWARFDDANIDESVYVGGPGIALAYLRRGLARGSPKELEQAAAYLDPWERRNRRAAAKRQGLGCSLLCGLAGWLYAKALHASATNRPSEASKFSREYLELHQHVLADGVLDADEWLYGRAGYLHGLLQLQATGLGGTNDFGPVIEAVARQLLRNGRRCSERLGAGWPLQWTWHGKAYIGGAHGSAGILYMLLHVPAVLEDREACDLIFATIDKLITLKTQEGNFPGKCGEPQASKLVHFCHGATGFVYLFCKAFEVSRQPRYLEEAKAAGEVVWRYGLLKKGPGLCHGISGSGYALLAVLRTSGEPRWLGRAFFFARALASPEVKEQLKTPDHPWSLFEGWAGALAFVLDLQTWERAAMPVFEISRP